MAAAPAMGFGACVAVVCSRSFFDYDLLCKTLDGLNVTIIEIISGGDSLGAMYARDRGIPLTEFLPDWKKHGKAAGFIRNTDIVKDADIVVAFWDGASHGTRDSITKAKEMGKVLYIVTF